MAINRVIERAISIAGSQTALAARVGVSQKTVHTWLNGCGISSRYVTRIVRATKGEVSTDDLLWSLSQPEDT